MDTYRISFDNGTTDTIQAASVEYDYNESIFWFRGEDGKTVAWVPSVNVLSVTGVGSRAAT